MMSRESIPSFAQVARTVPEMLDAVRTLKDFNSVRALPYLARIDRRAPGWLISILGSLTAVMLAFIFLFALAGALIWALPQIAWQVVHFIQSNRQGLWVERALGPAVYILIWIAIMGGAGLLVYRLQKKHRFLTSHTLWPGEKKPGLVLRIPLRAIEFFVQALMLALTVGLAAMALLPVGVWVMDMLAILIGWPDAPIQALERFGLEWYWGAGISLLLFALAIYRTYRAQRRHSTDSERRSRLVRIILVLSGFLGLADLAWTAWQREIPLPVMGVALLLILAHPLGISWRLTGLLRLPFLLFRNALYWALQRLELRIRLAVALWHHIRRNRKQTAGDTWSSVCKSDLRRLVTRSERLAYRVKINYACCPDCDDDSAVYNNVNCLVLHFDKSMDHNVEQAGSALLLNSRWWMGLSPKNMSPPFDALVIRDVDVHDIEAFVETYTNQPLGPQHKPLRQVTARIASGTYVPINDRNLLEKFIGRLHDDYDSAQMPDPCGSGLRIQEAVHTGARRARRIVRKVLLIVLVMAILAGLLFGAWQLFGEDLWESLRNELGSAQATSTIQAPSFVSSNATASPTLRPLATATQFFITTPKPSQTPHTPDNMPLILVPGGTFTMGNPLGNSEEHSKDEYPAHSVTLEAFYIDQHEVTNAQYRQCVDAGVCQPPESNQSHYNTDYYTAAKFDNYPVIKVTWFQAQEYCVWAGRRLPTEAEWEYAASFDPTSDVPLIYPWGTALPDENLANFGFSTYDTTTAGYFTAGRSALGIDDLAGNVMEWVSDWYDPDYYTQSPIVNPTGPDGGSKRVARGGSWITIHTELRNTARMSYYPQQSRFDLGFRCAISEP